MSCASCNHGRNDHSAHGEPGKGRCMRLGCGCYGFFRRVGDGHCDNPNCPGTECSDARRAEHTTDQPHE